MPNQKGFTLIELMVVIAIIAILSAIGIPAYQGYIAKAAMTDMLHTFGTYRSAIELCALNHGGLDSCNSGSHDIPHSSGTRYISETNVTQGTVALVGRESLQGLMVVLTPRWRNADATIQWSRNCIAPDNAKLSRSCEEVFRFDETADGPDAMSAYPSLNDLCRQFNALLLDVTDATLRIASSTPPAESLLGALRAGGRRTIDIEIWSARRIELWQACCHFTADKEESGHLLTNLLNEVLGSAVQQRASDIHFEPGQKTYRIRLRIDGVLHPQPLLPCSVAPQLTARLKVLASLDIAEKRLPQDGQIDYLAGDNPASFRVSTLPCRYGEKLVLRLLQQGTPALNMTDLGMPAREASLFDHALTSPQGLVLITGPTGSGKTVSLYSALARLNQVYRNICTVEDPIEIPFSGLNQTQVHVKAGLTYSSLLRALLRQDPDVIMIGEIRDHETAEIAVKAAQTGHLVLSTLHTHSTIATLTRLEQLSIPREILASSLRLVVAQRLVRKLCPHCRQQHKAPAECPTLLPSLSGTHWQASGCSRCYGGYYGRTALFEVLSVSDMLRGLISRGENLAELEVAARKEGMTTLLENGCDAVASGITSQKEIQRVLGQRYG